MFLFDFPALLHSILCDGNKYKTFKVNKTLFNEAAKGRGKTKLNRSLFSLVRLYQCSIKSLSSWSLSSSKVLTPKRKSALGHMQASGYKAHLLFRPQAQSRTAAMMLLFQASL